jgi:hypothetical protein
MGASGGPGADSEAAFRADLPRRLAQWQHQLWQPSGNGVARLAIAQDAAGLRAHCESRRWTPLVALFGRVEQAAAHSDQMLRETLTSLLTFGAPAEPPMVRPGASPTAPDANPMTVRMDAPFGATVRLADAPGARPASNVRPAAGAPAPSPAAGRPPTPLPGVGQPPGPEAPGASGVLGFRAFGKRAPEPAAPAAPAHSAVLGLGKLKSTGPRAPQFAPPVVPGTRQRASSSSHGDRRISSTGASARRTPWAAVFAIGATLVALVGGVVAVVAYRAHSAAETTSAADAQAPPTDAAAMASSTTSDGAVDLSQPVPDQVEVVSTRVHALGQESPELKALLDLQSHLAARCIQDSSTCGHGWTPFSREAIDLVDAGVLVRGRSDGPLSMWLQRLRVPHDFPVHDNTTIRNVFDYNTKNIAGRQRFQGMLFSCGAYSDIFEGTLEKYGAPQWLMAVVFQESGCDPLATSPTGARGLWQFMPESARAYGLKVVEGEVDERLNSVKATDAGVHFLTDLHRQVGAWDLALAAYNMGPYGLVGRLVRVGSDAGFWDLVDANLLPDETAGYVPAIEAYALILENLTRLDFSRDSKRLESTAEIMVKPGLRLSFIARAAHTSTLRIRDLNPEFLKDMVPSGEETARVPDSEAHRAQVFVETVSPNDDRDTCVPEDFDWGARVYETSKYAAACHAAADAGARIDAGRAKP